MFDKASDVHKSLCVRHLPILRKFCMSRPLMVNSAKYFDYQPAIILVILSTLFNEASDICTLMLISRPDTLGTMCTSHLTTAWTFCTLHPLITWSNISVLYPSLFQSCYQLDLTKLQIFACWSWYLSWTFLESFAPYICWWHGHFTCFTHR